MIAFLADDQDYDGTEEIHVVQADGTRRRTLIEGAFSDPGGLDWLRAEQG